MNVILSIKPEYAEKILDGSKKFEFRKVSFSNQRVENVLMYATRPVAKVIGQFKVRTIHVDKPKSIWQKTKNHAGIPKSFFDDYYRDRVLAVAIEVESVLRYDVPIALSDFGLVSAPQSFQYYESDLDRQLTLAL